MKCKFVVNMFVYENFDVLEVELIVFFEILNVIGKVIDKYKKDINENFISWW